MNEIILQSRDLAAGYGGRAVLRDMSFSVRPGEILTLIGPNGAGKSTLLKTIARQLEPLAGTVLLDGENLSGMAENTLAKSLSILTTERVRAERMCCAEVVATGRYPYTGRLGILSEHDRAVGGVAAESLSDLVANVAGFDEGEHEGVGVARDRGSRELQLADGGGYGSVKLEDLSFDQISDGQRQRIMLARALCQEPEVLLLDEPTSFLDVRYQVEFLTTLKRLVRGKSIAVVMSLHELNCAECIADTVLCVRNGGIDRIGSPDDIFRSEYIEELYGMDPGAYKSFFGSDGDERFFRNRGCRCFPCHRGIPEQEFNCLFCYCPLYTLGDRCGGNFSYTEAGVKSCENCAFPHRRENYEKLLARWPEISALAGRCGDGL